MEREANTDLICCFCKGQTIERTNKGGSNVYYCVKCKKYIGNDIYDEPIKRPLQTHGRGKTKL